MKKMGLLNIDIVSKNWNREDSIEDASLAEALIWMRQQCRSVREVNCVIIQRSLPMFTAAGRRAKPILDQRVFPNIYRAYKYMFDRRNERVFQMMSKEVSK